MTKQINSKLLEYIFALSNYSGKLLKPLAENKLLLDTESGLEVFNFFEGEHNVTYEGIRSLSEKLVALQDVGKFSKPKILNYGTFEVASPGKKSVTINVVTQEYLAGTSIADIVEDATSIDKLKWTDQVVTILSALYEVGYGFVGSLEKNIFVSVDGYAFINDYASIKPLAEDALLENLCANYDSVEDIFGRTYHPLVKLDTDTLYTGDLDVFDKKYDPKFFDDVNLN